MIPDTKCNFEEGMVLLFDKPLYWTSFDLVNKVRIMIKSALEIRKIKVGHAGTLDPLADGLMIICTGKATKRVDEFRDMDKEYLATIRIGDTTSSYDLETEITGNYPTGHINENLIKNVLEDFTGEQLQIPPAHSAKLIKGKRSYEYARKGIERKLAPVTVHFREIELLSFELPDIKTRLVCSKGTYVRSFAHDLGIALGSGACLSALRRTAIGPFRVESAYSIEKFENFIREMKQI